MIGLALVHVSKAQLTSYRQQRQQERLHRERYQQLMQDHQNNQGPGQLRDQLRQVNERHHAQQQQALEELHEHKKDQQRNLFNQMTSHHARQHDQLQKNAETRHHRSHQVQQDYLQQKHEIQKAQHIHQTQLAVPQLGLIPQQQQQTHRHRLVLTLAPQQHIGPQPEGTPQHQLTGSASQHGPQPQHASSHPPRTGVERQQPPQQPPRGQQMQFRQSTRRRQHGPELDDAQSAKRPRRNSLN